MTTKPIIEERIAFYENLIDKYSKNQKYISRLETQSRKQEEQI